MTLADLEVVRVVSRCNLNAACTEFLIYIFICDNGYLSANKRKNERLADQILISLVFGVNRDSRIAEKRLGTCGCDFNKPVGILNRILNMPKVTCLLGILNFGVRQRGFT